MDIINHHQAVREVQRMRINREELVDRIAHGTHTDGYIQPLQGIHLGRFSAPLDEIHGILDPSFCVIAQGSKEILWATAAIDTTPTIIFSPPCIYRVLAMF